MAYRSRFIPVASRRDRCLCSPPEGPRPREAAPEDISVTLNLSRAGNGTGTMLEPELPPLLLCRCQLFSARCRRAVDSGVIITNGSRAVDCPAVGIVSEARIRQVGKQAKVRIPHPI